MLNSCFLFKLTLLKLKSYTTFNPFFFIFNPHKAFMAEIVYRLQFFVPPVFIKVNNHVKCMHIMFKAQISCSYIK